MVDVVVTLVGQLVLVTGELSECAFLSLESGSIEGEGDVEDAEGREDREDARRRRLPVRQNGCR